VSALLCVHGVEAEIVDDEQVDSDELAQLGLVALRQPRVLERLEHAVGAQREHRKAAAARQVAECVGDESLADTDGADDGDVSVRRDDAHAGRALRLDGLLVRRDAQINSRRNNNKTMVR